MLTQYKNIRQIYSAPASISADRIDNRKLQFTSKDINSSFYPEVSIGKGLDSVLEFHIYTGNDWLSGQHRVNLVQKLPSFKNKETNATISLDNPIGIDISKIFKDLKLTAGNFRIVVNFFKNLIGSYERQHLRIDEISPDRTELRLRAIDDADPEFLQQITTI